jgi:hypothetical protein
MRGWWQYMPMVRECQGEVSPPEYRNDPESDSPRYPASGNDSRKGVQRMGLP